MPVCYGHQAVDRSGNNAPKQAVGCSISQRKRGRQAHKPNAYHANALQFPGAWALAVGYGFKQGRKGGKTRKAERTHRNTAQFYAHKKSNKMEGQQNAAYGKACQVACRNSMPGRITPDKADAAKGGNCNHGPAPDKINGGTLAQFAKNARDTKQNRGCVHADQGCAHGALLHCVLVGCCGRL